MNPAVQLMHSRDLVNWELAGYCTDKLDLGPAFRLEDGRGIYGRGIWAPCIRYHNGMFYVFSNVNGAGLQVFRSKSIKGPWEHNQLPGRHDLSVLFDDDGKIYIISGAATPIRSKNSLRTSGPSSPAPGANWSFRRAWVKVTTSTRSKASTTTSPPFPAAQSIRWWPGRLHRRSVDGQRMVQGESMGVTAAAPARATTNDRGL